MSKNPWRIPSLLRLGADLEQVIAQRARAFRAQLEAWTRDGGPGVPLLTLPDAPPPEPGRCVSCGAPAPTWRCTPCLWAVHLALGLGHRGRGGGPPAG